jgi:hypothetical protein
MPEYSGKSHVTLRQLQVGFANTGRDHINDHFTRTDSWRFMVSLIMDAFLV